MQHNVRRPLVAGNWKMNGTLAESRARAAAVAAGFRSASGADVALLPPALHVSAVANALMQSPVLLGAQDVSEHDDGAHTGELSGAMLRDVGCVLVLVGHSERRHGLGESDAQVARKFVAAQRAGLVPVLCVGETLIEREAGRTVDIVRRQLDAVLSVVGGFADAVLAYEPVWAIGTGRHATAEQAQEVHAVLRARLREVSESNAQMTRILYGGSVKAGNANALFAMQDVDGVLVGGASLDAKEFLDICAQAR